MANLARSSQKLATQLGDQTFIRSLLREVRNNSAVEDLHAQLIAQDNVKCLINLADMPSTAQTIAAEGGMDVAMSIVKSGLADFAGSKKSSAAAAGSTETAMARGALGLLDKLLEKNQNSKPTAEMVDMLLATLKAYAPNRDMMEATLRLLDTVLRDSEMAERFINNAGE